MGRSMLTNGRGQGRGYIESLTRYEGVMGPLAGSIATEANVQTRVRQPFRFTNLYVRNTNNALTGATTITFRIDGVDGNNSVSIAGGATGEIEDATSTDDVVDTDLINTEITTGAGSHNTSIGIRVISYIVGSSDHSILMAQGDPVLNAPQNVTRYTNFVSVLAFTGSASTVGGEVRFHHTGTLSDLRCFVTQNQHDTATTLTVRKNDSNVNQTLSITANTTGEFEDTVNTDAIADGDDFNLEIVTGTSGMAADDLDIGVIQMHMESPVSNLFCGNSGGALSTFDVRYFPMGAATPVAATTEGDVQTDARVGFTARHYSLSFSSNGFNGATVFTFRRNEADTDLQISIPATTSGQFEDLDEEVFIQPTDEINHEIDSSASSSGTAGVNMVGLDMEVDDFPHHDMAPRGIERITTARAY